MVKVYLKYPWKFVDSSYYRNLVNSAPNGVEYVNKRNIKSIDSKAGFNINKFLKIIARKVITLLRIPNYVYVGKGDYNLIHCAHCLPINSKVPFVVDFERYETLSINGYYARSNGGIRKIRSALLSDNCKKILPWTIASKNSLLKYIDNKNIKNKIEILPFALPLKKYKLERSEKSIRILFVGRYFEAKGGYFAFEVMDFLTRKYKNVEGIVVSQLPRRVLEKYSHNNKIKFYDLMNQEKLFKEIYAKSDILFYPGFSDTFGFALVEALMFKLPIVTFEGFARDEIVKDGKNGFIVKRREGVSENWIEVRKSLERRYIDEAILKTETLILDSKLRKRMGEEGYNMIKDGKFSIQNRNRILKKIYMDALK